MKNYPFTLIKGGLDSPDTTGEKKYISGYITDTRLMGVFTAHVHWLLGDGETDYHQFFYADAEEFGLESYESITGDNPEQLEALEGSLLGGLGGSKVNVTEREFCSFINHMVEFNKARKQPLPDRFAEFSFMIERSDLITGKDYFDFEEKLCCPIMSTHHAINYFLMRCAGKDFQGARHLLHPDAAGLTDEELDVFSNTPACTFCMNTIDYDRSSNTYTEDGHRLTEAFLCESILELNSKYLLTVASVSTMGKKIISASCSSSFGISSVEAAMKLSKPEFISVYDILIGPDEFDRQAASLTIDAMMTVHPSGKLFMFFNKNNNHVDSDVFRLSDDVFGMFYVTSFGQLLISSNELSSIRSLETSLKHCSVSRNVVSIAKFEFKDPIMYEFIQSEFEDFMEFLDCIRDDE
ncbi:MAG: hypothetical protein K6F52_02460 [Clostridia bacterium]|nr:hypothetical protein [Clostridia bacterium]